MESSDGNNIARAQMHDNFSSIPVLNRTMPPLVRIHGCNQRRDRYAGDGRFAAAHRGHCSCARRQYDNGDILPISAGPRRSAVPVAAPGDVLSIPE